MPSTTRRQAHNTDRRSVVEGQIIAFLNGQKKKGINGKKRYPQNLPFVVLPINNGHWMYKP